MHRASTGSVQTTAHPKKSLLARSQSSTLTTEELNNSPMVDPTADVYVTKTRSLVSQWFHGKTQPQERRSIRQADVIKEGTLLKQGLRLKMWTRRFFLLRLEDHHMTLGYYTSKDDLTLCAEMPIGPGHRLLDRSSAKHPFRMELRSGTRSLMLEAETPEDFTSWKIALEEAIRWHNVMVDVEPGNRRVVKYGSQALEHMAAEQAKATQKQKEKLEEEEARKKLHAKKSMMEKRSKQSDKASRPKYLPATREGNQCFVASNARFDIPLKFEYRKTIGSGAYGVVISARDSELNKDVAIKNIQKAFDDLTDAKRILRELKIMKHLGEHKHILGVSDILPPVSLKTFEDVYIVSECMATDLHRVIYSRHALSNEHVAYFMYQMLCALKYMHSANILHRDLKPSNILVNGNCELRICDFGLARGFVPNDENDLTASAELTEYVVTRWYRAPEIMLGCVKYSSDVDVWALGCMFVEMITRAPLFPGQDYIDQLHLIMDTLGAPEDSELGFLSNPRALKFVQTERAKRKGKALAKSLPSLFSKQSIHSDALDLMTRMLVINPAERISVDEALAHPYFHSIRVPEDEITCPTKFDFEFETRGALEKEDIQQYIWDEMLEFHPEVKETAEVKNDSKTIPLAALVMEDNQLEHEVLVKEEPQHEGAPNVLEKVSPENQEHEGSAVIGS